MIQRKQTLYLLAVVALMVGMLLMPLMNVVITAPGTANTTEILTDGSIQKTFTNLTSNVELNVWGLYRDGSKEVSLTFFVIVIFITIASALATIFLYRRRALQIRICFVILMELFGAIIYAVMYIVKLNSILESEGVTAVKYSMSVLFPLLAMICVWQAFRGITKDIALLDSLNRIR